MSARDAGHKALSKLGSGDQLVISTAGPRDKPTWWRKSTQTVLFTGGTIQSGTITAIDSRVGPANTNVPNTAKPAVPVKRRFADYGSNAISASSCPYAFTRTPSACRVSWTAGSFVFIHLQSVSLSLEIATRTFTTTSLIKQRWGGGGGGVRMLHI